MTVVWVIYRPCEKMSFLEITLKIWSMKKPGFESPTEVPKSKVEYRSDPGVGKEGKPASCGPITSQGPSRNSHPALASWCCSKPWGTLVEERITFAVSD